jgi:hypothetical protein
MVLQALRDVHALSALVPAVPGTGLAIFAPAVLLLPLLLMVTDAILDGSGPWRTFTRRTRPELCG